MKALFIQLDQSIELVELVGVECTEHNHTVIWRGKRFINEHKLTTGGYGKVILMIFLELMPSVDLDAPKASEEPST